MVVTENHALADHVLHVQVIGHGTHYVGPKPFALLQRQFDELAAGDVRDAQDHSFIVGRVLRQAQHQPQMLVAAGGVQQFDFQLQLLLLIEHCFEHLIADGAAIHWIAVYQQVPGLLGGVDVEQLQGDLVDFGHPQRLQQLPTLFRDREPCMQLLVAVQLGLVEDVFEAGHIEHAQRDAGTLENLLIAATAFMQLALAAAHVQ
ncbi:hypothetical protein D3C84_699870 [compost metagenome]